MTRITSRLSRVVLAALVSLAGCAAVVAASGLASPQTEAPRPPFADWLSEVRRDALQRGIRAGTIDAAFADLAPVDTVRERDRSQAEFVMGFDAYVRRWLKPSFVRLGREKSRPHRALLGQVSKKYGVPPAVLVAVWGVESNYGRFSGVRPVVATLATLAYDTRRAAFFRGELLDALAIVDRGDIELARLNGSWAGAMGQPQFMPSSYLRYAQDFDGDGRRDIWATPGDIFASIANYLAEHGWRTGEPWGRRVIVDARAAERAAALEARTSGCRAEREMTVARPMQEWHAMGVRLPGGKPLPSRGPEASLVRVEDRAFLVHANYDVVLTYNCAHHYALGVSMLSDRLRGGP